MSSSHDRDVKLWSEDGVLVGVFGVGLWQLDDPTTWHGREREPLQVRAGGMGRGGTGRPGPRAAACA